jgi:anti-anti-sigma factor
MTRDVRNIVSETPGAKTKLLVSEGVLVLATNLQRADYSAFENACRELQQSQYKKILLDLTRCTYVSSLFIGILVDSVTQMKAEGKEVMVHVSPEVGRFLHMAHLYHLIQYKILDATLKEKTSES